MKIAFVVESFPLLSETFITNQIIGLIDLGYQVDIFSFLLGDTSVIHSDVRKYGLLKKVKYLDPFILITLFRLLYLKKIMSYDIVHCQMGTVGLRILPLRRLGIFRGKLVVHLRGWDITEYVKQNGERVYMNLFKDADYILVVCDYLRKRAIELGCPKDKIKVVRSGIDLKRFKFHARKNPAKDKIKIVFVGRLAEKKGVKYAVLAISILKKKGYNVELLIIGDGPLKIKLQELSKELNINKNVKFLGAMNHDEIVNILNRAHLFVAPSVTSKSGDQEGIPNVLKEAMAVGLPVVSTFHGGVPELVEDGVSGYLVPERDSQALADKLGYLIDHPGIWKKMGRAGRKFVEKNYDKEKLNKELVEIYESLI